MKLPPLLITICISLIPVILGLQSDSKWEARPENKDVSMCNLCNEIVNDVFQHLQNGSNNDRIVDFLVQKCDDLKLHSEKICRGTAALAAPTVRYIYQNSKVVPGNVCGILFQTENCTLSDPNKVEWTITPSAIPKPPVKQFAAPPPGATTIKVLHIADPHWDPEYLEGSNANCPDPMCCRASSGLLTRPEDAAGYWGDYRSCDMPWRTIENAVAHMAKHHSDVSYIIWTGDLTPHNNWATDKEEILMINSRLLKLMKRYFPNTPLYPTLGNHDSHPANTFSPPEVEDAEISTSWLFDNADTQWSQWLPEEASSTIRHGGYYTALVQPGLRIVSMNMNYCYTFNWWTLYTKSKDPASGLLWLRTVLEEAEQAGEKVHIISHIPPGNDDCWSIFSREFGKIINRFESTVAAQFYGHTHREEIRIFYDEKTPRPVNVAFIAGSITSFINLNPSYRVYSLDGPRPDATWAVTDFTTWAMNLTEANLRGPEQDPVWSELYQAKEEYGLTDLSPSSIESLIQNMLKDEALFQRYFRNYHKDVDAVVSKGCDAKCRARILCLTVTTNIADQRRCDYVKHRVLKKAVQHQEL